MSVFNLHPTWPEVRCTQCGTVYVVNLDPLLVMGDCPKCHCQTYNTSMPIEGNLKLYEE